MTVPIGTPSVSAASGLRAPGSATVARKLSSHSTLERLRTLRDRSSLIHVEWTIENIQLSGEVPDRSWLARSIPRTQAR